MLLHRKRPGVAPVTVLVVLQEDEFPEEGRPARRTVSDEKDHDHSHAQEEVEGRIDLEPSADQKPTQPHGTVGLVLPEQDSGDEKPAEDKEQIDANPTSKDPDVDHSTQERMVARSIQVDMANQDEQHRDRAEDINRAAP